MLNPQNTLRKTTGIGIICGLEIEILQDCSVILTEGYGISSTGHLLYSPERHFKYVKPFDKEVKGLIPEDSDIPVWELIDTRSNPTDEPLIPQKIQADRFIDDKVLFIYWYPGELEEGLQSGPTNSLQIATKALVIEKADAWELQKTLYKADAACLLHKPFEREDTELFDFEEDEAFSGERFFQKINPNTALGSLHMMRFGYGAERKECDPEEQVFAIDAVFPLGDKDPDLFESVVEEFKILIESLIEELESCVKALHQDVFHPLIPKNQRKYVEDYLEFLILKRWPQFYRSEQTKQHIQYFWDFCRDLGDTYNELIQELCYLMADCCPDTSLFPYHLFVGELTEEIAFGPTIFRSLFRQAPIYNGNADRLERIRMLHWRIAMMIKCFYIPGVEPNDIADDHFAQVLLKDHTGLSEDIPEVSGEIKLTPAKGYRIPTDEYAVPFYYYLARDPNSILFYWSYDAVKCGNLHLLRSYHADSEDSHTSLCAIKMPFAYDIRPYPFYRIEGHVGDSVSEVLVRLTELKEKHNLDFDIIPVSLEEFFYPFDKEECTYPIFSCFYGAEHLAGVEKGGTFILVYENERDEDNCLITNPVRLDFSLRSSCCLLGKQFSWLSKRIIVKGKIEWVIGQLDKPTYKPAAELELGASFSNVGYTTPFAKGRTRFWSIRTTRTGSFCFSLSPNFHGVSFDRFTGPRNSATGFNSIQYSQNTWPNYSYNIPSTRVLEVNSFYGGINSHTFSPYVFVVTDPTVAFVPDDILYEIIVDADGKSYRRIREPLITQEGSILGSRYRWEIETTICLRVKLLVIVVFVDDQDNCSRHLREAELSHFEIESILSFYHTRFREHRILINKVFLPFKLDQAVGVNTEFRNNEYKLEGIESELVQFVEDRYDSDKFNFKDRFCSLFEKIAVLLPPKFCNKGGFPLVVGSRDNFYSRLSLDNTSQSPGDPIPIRNLLRILVLVYLDRASFQSWNPNVVGLDPETVLGTINTLAGELPPSYQDMDFGAILKEWQASVSGYTNPTYLNSSLTLAPQKISSYAEAKEALRRAYEGLFDDAWYGRMFSVYGSMRRGFARSTPRSTFSITKQLEGFSNAVASGNDVSTQIRPDNPTLLNTWLCIYLTVFRAIRIISCAKNLRDKGVIGEEEYANLVGQARFLRALAHFDALRLWGYFWEEDSAIGVPIYEQYEQINKWDVPRSSVSEVYSSIQEDLIYAQQNSPLFFGGKLEEAGDTNRIPSSTLATQESVMAIRAKVYLYQKNFLEAKVLLDQVINEGQFALETGDNDHPNGFNKIFVNGLSSKELLFGAYSAKSKIRPVSDYYTSVEEIPNIEYRPSSSFQNVFQQDAVGGNLDDRYSGTLKEESGMIPQIIKYRGEDAPTLIIRYGEILLLASEVAAILGNLELAREFINQLRIRSRVNEITFPITDTTTILQWIYEERARELSFEGGNEWFDAIRFSQISDNVLESFYTLPIPERIVQVNDKIEQNPGYDGLRNPDTGYNPAPPWNIPGSTIPNPEAQPPGSVSPVSEVEVLPPDDLTKVLGIGPAIQRVLNAAEVTSYKELSSQSPDKLRQILREAGTRFEIHDPTNWPRQAKLASEGKMEELEQLKEELRANN